LEGEGGDGAAVPVVVSGVVGVPEGGVLDYRVAATRVFGVNWDGVMRTRESSDKEARGGIWDGSSQEVFGRTDRRGFTRVICAGSPDGSEVWLVILLGQTEGVDWLELVHHDQGVRPSGKIRRIEAKGVKIPALVQAACLVFYPDFFRGVPFSFGHFEEMSKRVGRVLDLSKDDLPLKAIEIASYQIGKRLQDLRFWEGELKPMPEAAGK
jgi:hypothetical protein